MQLALVWLSIQHAGVWATASTLYTAQHYRSALDRERGNTMRVMVHLQNI